MSTDSKVEDKKESSFSKGMSIAAGFIFYLVLFNLVASLIFYGFNELRKREGKSPIDLSWRIAPQQADVHWTLQGKSGLCAGRQRAVVFTCKSPSSGDMVSCVCK